MRITKLLFEVKCQNILGENVIWHNDEQALYWTDIDGKCLYKCLMTKEVADILSNDAISEQAISQRDDYINEVLQVFDMPYRLSSFAFTEHSDTILAGFEHGLAKYRYATGELTPLVELESDHTYTRFNDGRCDPLGRYWIGSMVEESERVLPQDHDKGALYRFDVVDNDITKVKSSHMLGGIEVSNGLCFSKDGSVMYHADSPSHKIYQYELAKSGEILNKKLFAKFDKHSFPDGACVDVNDNVWYALWGRACVVCLNSKGKEILRHPLPVTQGSCVSIGGPNMNWLFVTSAKIRLNEDQLDAQPRAGNLFVYEISEPVGRDEAIFK